MRQTLSLVFRQTANNTMFVILDTNNQIIKWTSVRRTFKELKKKQIYYKKVFISFFKKCLEYVQSVFRGRPVNIFNKIIFRGAVKKPRRFLLMLIEDFIFFKLIILSGQPPHNGCMLRKKRKGFNYRTYRRAKRAYWL